MVYGASVAAGTYMLISESVGWAVLAVFLVLSLAMALARAGANVAITYRGSGEQAEHVVIDLGGLGVQALDTGTGATVSHRGGERFLMASAAKLPLAAAVLHRAATDPALLARENAFLHNKLPSIQLLGGCCGTDHRHVTQIIAAWNDA